MEILILASLIVLTFVAMSEIAWSPHAKSA